MIIMTSLQYAGLMKTFFNLPLEIKLFIQIFWGINSSGMIMMMFNFLNKVIFLNLKTSNRANEWNIKWKMG